jgi:hypothetical protein
MPDLARHFISLEMTCLSGPHFTVKSAPCFATHKHNTTREIAYLLDQPAALTARRNALVRSYEMYRERWTGAIAIALGALAVP